MRPASDPDVIAGQKQNCLSSSLWEFPFKLNLQNMAHPQSGVRVGMPSGGILSVNVFFNGIRAVWMPVFKTLRAKRKGFQFKGQWVIEYTELFHNRQRTYVPLKMAHLFLASTIPVSGEDPHTSKGAPKPPKSSMKTPTLSTAPVDSKTTTATPATPSKKDTRKVTVTTVPLVNELQLTAATGGAEMSCYRCTIPFGVVVLIAGVVVTAVAYAFNSHGSTISVLGLVLLSAGLGLLASSAVCWRLRRRRKSRDKRRESTTALMFNHDALLA
ncbi:unnamed protein product [Boreogadus saida]